MALANNLSSFFKNFLSRDRGRKSPADQTKPSDNNREKTYTCQICQRSVEESAALTHVKAEEYLLGLIKKDHPEWNQDKQTCGRCIEYYRELIKKAQI